MAKNPEISAILLAAGASKRLGRNKLLLPVGKGTVVRRAAEALLASRASEVIVVTGHEAGKVRAALEGLDLRFADNPRHAEGQSTSLVAGLSRASPGAEAFLFALGDQPLLTPALIDGLIEAFAGAEERPLAVWPTFGGRRGTPTLLSASLREELLRVQGDEGARSLIRRLQAEAPARVRAVEVESEELLWDLDTEADYRTLLERAEARDP